MFKPTQLSLVLLTLALAACQPEDNGETEASETPKPASETSSESSQNNSRQKTQYVSGFAILDMDKIARRLGSDQALLQALKQREAQMNQQLSQIREQLQTRLDERTRELAAPTAGGEEESSAEAETDAGNEENGEGQAEASDLTDAEKQELQGIARNMNQQFVKARNEAQQKLNQEERRLIENFRNQVRPIAEDVARERGFSIILNRNDALLFSYDQRFDITDEVIKRMSTPMVP